jgi:hypothetical protein
VVFRKAEQISTFLSQKERIDATRRTFLLSGRAKNQRSAVVLIAAFPWSVQNFFVSTNKLPLSPLVEGKDTNGGRRPYLIHPLLRSNYFFDTCPRVLPATFSFFLATLHGNHAHSCPERGRATSMCQGLKG